VEEEAFKGKTGECVFPSKFEPHAVMIHSPRLRVLALFTPEGLEEAFSSVSSPAQSLDKIHIAGNKKRQKLTARKKLTVSLPAQEHPHWKVVTNQ
jgi:hypothetical protein